MKILLSMLALLSACGEEVDVDVFVVLPDIRSQESIHAPVLTTCDLAGADHVELHVTGPGPESFTVTADQCGFDAELEAMGFLSQDGERIRIPRLEPAFYDLEARIYDEDGTLRGERIRPFDARDGVLPIIFQRPDLQNWPTEIAGLYIADCDADPSLERVAFSITPARAFGPIAEGEITCGAPPGTLRHDPVPNTIHVQAPVGPMTVSLEGYRAGIDDAPCAVADEEVVVSAGTKHFELGFDGGCAAGEGFDDQ